MTLLPFRIGITGSIATGKSTAVKELRTLGCKIIDADEIARTLFHKYHVAYYLLWLFFGKQVFEKDQVDRKKLASIVFNNPSKRKTLNLITHPFVISKMFLQYLYHVVSRSKYVFFDIPLLYESNLDRYMNQVWVIYVDEETQKNRLLSRMRSESFAHSTSDLTFDEHEMLKRISSQMSIEDKKLKATVVVKNTGSLMELQERIRYLVSCLENDC